MFPTVHFPNPEEPGAMDAALELAEQTGPDVVIANDPDADRCAVAVPGPGGWRMLRGDEVGALLGAHILARGVDARRRVFANSIVSSRLLAAMAKAAGVRHEETLTGFKWISRVEGLRYGYEEALGYCVDPPHVRDKDGVSAALRGGRDGGDPQGRGALADRPARRPGRGARRARHRLVLGAGGRPVADRHGHGPAARQPADRGGGHRGFAGRRPGRGQRGGLPPTEGLRYYLADDSRIIVRPSGTEPKLKVYLEVIEPVSSDLRAARKVAAKRLAGIRAAMEDLTQL